MTLKKGRHKKQKRLITPLLAGLAVVLLLLIGIRALYQHLYSHKTIVITESENYQKQSDFQGVAIYDQKVFTGSGIQIDPAAEGRRIGANQVIGRADHINPSADAAVEISAPWTDWIREGMFDRMQLHPTGAVSESVAEEVTEDPDVLNYKSLLSEEWIGFEQGTIRLKRSGKVSAAVDGYEHRLEYASAESLRPEEVRALLAQDGTSTDARAFTLVNDHSYVLALLADSEVFADDVSFVQIGEDRYPGTVLHTDTDGQDRLLVFYMDRGFDRVFPQRFLEGSLILREFPALVLPKSTRIEKNGQAGVYIKNDDAVVEFIALEDVEAEGDRLFVNLNNTELRIYDEIFLHPNAVKEGEFIE